MESDFERERELNTNVCKERKKKYLSLKAMTHCLCKANTRSRKLRHDCKQTHFYTLIQGDRDKKKVTFTKKSIISVPKNRSKDNKINDLRVILVYICTPMTSILSRCILPIPASLCDTSLMARRVPYNCLCLRAVFVMRSARQYIYPRHHYV